MKNSPILLSALTVTTLLTGCFSYTSRAPERTVVVTEQPVMTSPVRETVITTLPGGYRTRVYRGSTYYYSGNSYYRTHPRGGYVTVSRPW